MPVLSVQNLSVAFGSHKLLDQIELHLEENDKTCLIGRNGCGKTTLLKILCGRIKADQGKITKKKGLKISLLPQEIPQELEGSVYDVVMSGLDQKGKLLSEYYFLSLAIQTDNQPSLLNRLGKLQQQIDAANGWEIYREAENLIETFRLNAQQPFNQLSEGRKRRALFAKALIYKPDLLLLDEPTNHLDIESIEIIEKLICDFKGSVLFVTHDRHFLQKVATRIADIDFGKITSWNCDYHTFLQRKESLILAREKSESEFDRKIAIEEQWIRKGIKARRTRNEGRVRALQKMRADLQNRRKKLGQADLNIQNTISSGNLVMQVKNISFAYEKQPIIKNFSTTIMRGDKIGIIGANGSGKSTLIRTLLSEIPIQTGSIKYGVKLKVAYFDQLREQLKLNQSIRDNIAPEGDFVQINGESKHIISYLKDFLFQPEQIETPVAALSGGERNRLMLAKLFSQPANLLVLDEPTNDLDIETLEILESILVSFSGTILMVSHDRSFLNHVITSLIVVEGGGSVYEFFGDYDAWANKEEIKKQEILKTQIKKSKPVHKLKEKIKKLTLAEQKELQELPLKIEEKESNIESFYHQMSDPEYFKKPQSTIKENNEKLEKLKKSLDEDYQRWEALEEIHQNFIISKK